MFDMVNRRQEYMQCTFAVLDAERGAWRTAISPAVVNRRLAADAGFADVSVSGRFRDIYFRATKTLTITDARWLAYHIELSSRLRKPAAGLTGKPTQLAYRFCDHLAAALSEKHG